MERDKLSKFIFHKKMTHLRYTSPCLSNLLF